MAATLNRRHLALAGISGTIAAATGRLAAAATTSVDLGPHTIARVRGIWEYDAGVSDDLSSSAVDVAAWLTADDLFAVYLETADVESQGPFLISEFAVLNLLTFDNQTGELIDMWVDGNVTYAVKSFAGDTNRLVLFHASEIGGDLILQIIVSPEDRFARVASRISAQFTIDGDPATDGLDINTVQDHIANPTYTRDQGQSTGGDGTATTPGTATLGAADITWLDPWVETAPNPRSSYDMVVLSTDTMSVALYRLPGADTRNARAAVRAIVDEFNALGNATFDLIDRWRENGTDYALVTLALEDGTNAIDFMTCTEPDDGGDYIVVTTAIGSLDAVQTVVTAVQSGIAIDGNAVWEDVASADLERRITDLAIF